MLSHSELKKGVKIILEGEPYEVLESNSMKKAQRRVVIQTKVRNLVNGNVLSRNFHQGDVLEEAELQKLNAKFLYSHRGRYFFCQEDASQKRFDLGAEQIGSQVQFLKQNQVVEAVVFEEKIINISLPIKVHLRVAEAPPGIRGDRAQGGTKIATLETGAKINVPLFIEESDIIEVNTEKGEYVKRA